VPFTIASTAEGIVVRLEGAVTSRNAQELAAALTEAVTEGLPVAVEARGLEDVDTCILQLLCSLGKTVPGLSIQHPSQALLSALERSGLRRELAGVREDS
jgi:anti-anti-sigma regulatory factor